MIKTVLSRAVGASPLRVVSALSLLIALSGCASSTDEEVRRLQARSVYEQALKSLADKQVSAGLSSRREAVRLDPQSPIFRNTLGVVLLALRKPAEAEIEFRKAVELDPSYAEAQHNTGLSSADRGG